MDPKLLRQWKTISNIHYYIREGLYGTALQHANEKIFDSDATIVILRAVIHLLLGKTAEAMRLLDAEKKGALALGALQGLLWAYESETNQNKQAIASTDKALFEAMKSASEDAICSASEVLLFAGKAAKARVLLEKISKDSGNSARTRCLLGWVELSSGRDQRSTQQLFESAADDAYPDARIGICKIHESHHSPGEMKAAAAHLITQDVTFVPAYIEKAKAAMMAKEWDIAIQTLQNSSVVESENVLCSLITAVHAVTQSGKQVEKCLKELQSAIDTFEKENHRLHFKIAQILVRASGKNMTVVTFAKTLAAGALRLNACDEYEAEALRISTSMNDAKSVLSLARNLLQSTVEDPYVALGMTIGFLMNDKPEDAKAQYGFVHEAHQWIDSHPLYHYVGALLERKSAQFSFEKYMKHINNALDLHISRFQSIPFGLDFLRLFDSEFLMTMAQELMTFAPLVPTKASDDSQKAVDRILSLVTEHCPGLSSAAFMLARVRYLQMDSSGAEEMVQRCLQLNDAVAEAYLLRAQIKIDKGQVKEADECLTTGLNFNFAVRESLLFYLIKSKVLKGGGEVERAAEMLRVALKQPKTNTAQLAEMSTEAHVIAMQIEYIDCLQTMKRTKEAETALSEAMAQWRGRPEEDQLVLMSAQLQLAKGDPDAALAVLAKVQPGQPNYQTALLKMAEIYLEEKHDKRQFTLCYKELLRTSPTVSTYVLLGDAYMNVQEPEKAIEAYEQAQKLGRSAALNEKIGEAYVQCHLYSKAVNFYESMMNAGRDRRMRVKLAELLFLLHNFEKCERILKAPLNEDPNPIDPEKIAEHVKYYQLLSNVHHEQGDWNEAVADLENAKNLQMKLVQKNDSPSNLEAKKEAAKICCQQAQLLAQMRDFARATELYKTAMQLNESDAKIVVSLAATYLHTNAKQCMTMCNNALRIDRNNDEAILLLADLHYQQNDVSDAVAQFRNILQKHPNHYHALARYVELSWRLGNVDEAENKLKAAAEENPRAAANAGYNYCKGLLAKFGGEPNAALQAFNRSRRDLEWGEKSLYSMIDICLNPDNEVIGGEIEHADGDDANRDLGAKMAERFMKDLQYRSPLKDARHTLMELFIQVASTDKYQIQMALNQLLNIIGPDDSEVQSVGAVLGASRAYIFLKQLPKAKALLKRVIDFKWTIDDAEHLEKCWLLLTDLYIGQTKLDQANNVLAIVLKHNGCCIRAHEFMGVIREKESRFSDAANHYEDAWRIGKRRSPAIGYKLAFNYLKCRRIFDAIEVCHLVLEQNPTYPHIKKDILDKARSMIRT